MAVILFITWFGALNQMTNTDSKISDHTDKLFQLHLVYELFKLIYERNLLIPSMI